MKQTTLIKPQIEAEGKQRMGQGVENFHTSSGKTRDIIGSLVGVSGRTAEKAVGLSPCPVCGYVNVPGLVICWKCGFCLDPRIRRLAE